MLHVITGGEPLLQATSVGELCGHLRDVEIETNGTLPPWGNTRGH